MDTLEKVRNYLVENHMPGKSAKDLPTDESILESGILDSAGIFDLVAFLERTFDIRIDDEDIVADNFDSLASITKMVEARLK
jgi:acyl carrier protein